MYWSLHLHSLGLTFLCLQLNFPRIPSLIGKNVKPVETNEYSFVVYVKSVQRCQPNNVKFCGGTAISVKHILTAEKCLKIRNHPLNSDEVLVTVHGGSRNLSATTVYNVSSSISYKEWARKNRGTEIHFTLSIAIITLKEQIDEDKMTSVYVPCSVRRENFDRKPVSVIGWGSLRNCANPEILHKSSYDLQQITTDECKAEFLDLDELYGQHIVCTEADPQLADGDVGGPLLHQDYHIVGIGMQVKKYQAGDRTVKMNVFMKITPFMRFIYRYISTARHDVRNRWTLWDVYAHN